MLCQYAFFLQKKANECDGFLKWASSTMNKIKNDDIARLTNMIKEVEQRSTRIAYLARRIEMIAQSLTNINRARWNEGRTS